MKIIRQYLINGNLRRKLDKEQYAEIPCIDYYEDGTMVEGSEDFSSDRFYWQTAVREVYRKTSEKNRGGHYIWEHIGTVRCRNSKECGQLARILYPDETLSIRY